MTKFIKSVAAAAVLATSATGTQAATLNTDVDVTLPSIIALYCYDAVSIDVTAAGLVAAFGGNTDGGALDVGTPKVATDDFSPDLNAQGHADVATTGAFGTTADLTLTNVCAFRALVGSGGVTVVVSQPDGTTMAHEDNGTGVEIEATGASLVAGQDYTTGLGLANIKPISVLIPLDLTNATEAGKYTKADLFTVTVTAL